MSKFSEDAVVECFKAIDTDGSGYICRKELKGALQALEVPDNEMEDMLTIFMSEDDKDGDGKISLEEFKNGILGQVSQ